MVVFTYSACNYMFIVDNENTTARCEIGPKSTIKTPQRRHWCRYCLTLDLHLVLLFLLITLNMLLRAGCQLFSLDFQVVIIVMYSGDKYMSFYIFTILCF